jgi:hypothetical protein
MSDKEKPNLIEQWNAMTPRERDAWIAEHVMGWEYVNECIESHPDTVILHPPYAFDLAIGEPYFNWDPNSNISAAMEAEEKIMQMDVRTQIDYITHLHEILGLQRVFLAAEDMLRIIHASAADRAKAMYLTLMKEREEGCN